MEGHSKRKGRKGEVLRVNELEQWRKDPLVIKLMATEEVFWLNPHIDSFKSAVRKLSLHEDDVKDAEKRLDRFAPYIAKVFPGTNQAHGMIESPLVQIPSMKQSLEQKYLQPITGNLLLKCDSHLPISGSIKARGGIYEVLKHAEQLALQHGLLTVQDDYSILDSETCRDFFANYSIAVGSTGNLGLSIGIISAKLGFNVSVHMSADAKQWKKDLLRSKNVNVIEYEDDYSQAVEEGRREAEQDPTCYFVDDEQSQDLFLGYAVAAFRLKKQLAEQKITVDESHPLFVYLPCGVGGAPGGITFGLKLLFEDHVHCFFAEPTHSPSMLLGLLTGLHERISVQEIGLDNRTEADGLAVGRPSGLVSRLMKPLLSGSFTIDDDKLFTLLKELADAEGLFLEPSALAGMLGPIKLVQEGNHYLKANNLAEKMNNATHIIWGTGGSMVPEEEMMAYYRRGGTIK